MQYQNPVCDLDWFGRDLLCLFKLSVIYIMCQCRMFVINTIKFQIMRSVYNLSKSQKLRFQTALKNTCFKHILLLLVLYDMNERTLIWSSQTQSFGCEDRNPTQLLFKPWV